MLIQRAKQSVDTLFDMKKFIPRFAERGAAFAQLWRQCSLPLLSALARQSTNAAREVRHAALIHLQRLLLGQQILPPSSITTTTPSLPSATANDTPASPAVADPTPLDTADAIFNRVLFPLLDELLRPGVVARDARGMPETRLRAAALLCKVFVALEVNETAVSRAKDIRVTWVQILDLLDRLMNVGKRDQLVRLLSSSLHLLDFLAFFSFCLFVLAILGYILKLNLILILRFLLLARSDPRIAQERRARYERDGHPRPPTLALATGTGTRHAKRTAAPAMGRHARAHRAFPAWLPRRGRPLTAASACLSTTGPAAAVRHAYWSSPTLTSTALKLISNVAPSSRDTHHIPQKKLLI